MLPSSAHRKTADRVLPLQWYDNNAAIMDATFAARRAAVALRHDTSANRDQVCDRRHFHKIEAEVSQSSQLYVVYSTFDDAGVINISQARK